MIIPEFTAENAETAKNQLSGSANALAPETLIIPEFTAENAETAKNQLSGPAFFAFSAVNSR